MELSLVILSNKPENAKKAQTCCKFADEVIIMHEDNLTDYSGARNKGLKKAKGNWVFFLDDDEKISTKLKKEIKEAIKSNKYKGYYVKRHDNFLGRELRHGENGAVNLLRLAKRDAGKFHRPVHEVWYIDGRVGRLKNPLQHFPHKSISSFLSKINKYSTIEARYRHERGTKSSLYKAIVYPPAKFILNWVFRLGFLDGVPGTIMAIMMSFHSFQTWTKLYLLQNK